MNKINITQFYSVFLYIVGVSELNSSKKYEKILIFYQQKKRKENDIGRRDQLLLAATRGQPEKCRPSQKEAELKSQRGQLRTRWLLRLSLSL